MHTKPTHRLEVIHGLLALGYLYHKLRERLPLVARDVEVVLQLLGHAANDLELLERLHVEGAGDKAPLRGRRKDL